MNHRCTLLLLAVLAGCASVSVVPESAPTTSLSRPSQIYIQPFDTGSGKWEGPVSGETSRRQIQQQLASNMESRLSEIAPARIVSGTPGTTGWLIKGEFLRVNPGDKWARLWVGMGAGGSKFETRVQVFDLARSSTSPIAAFKTTGGTNQAGGTSTLNFATDDDIDRTSREIRDYLGKMTGATASTTQKKSAR